MCGKTFTFNFIPTSRFNESDLYPNKISLKCIKWAFPNHNQPRLMQLTSISRPLDFSRESIPITARLSLNPASPKGPKDYPRSKRRAGASPRLCARAIGRLGELTLVDPQWPAGESWITHSLLLHVRRFPRAVVARGTYYTYFPASLLFFNERIRQDWQSSVSAPTATRLID